MNKLAKSVIGHGTVALATLAGIYGLSKSERFMNYVNRDQREIERTNGIARISTLISDLDGKPGTSFDDWALVYDSTFGYPYDSLLCDPTKLSLEELSRIDIDKIRNKLKETN